MTVPVSDLVHGGRFCTVRVVDAAARDDAAAVTMPSHVVTRALEDESVLLNLKSETYFGLDAVGTRMLEVLQSAKSVSDAVTQLASEYDAEESTIRADLQSLLERLVENGLVELHGD